jgi:hypothetical protein
MPEGEGGRRSEIPRRCSDVRDGILSTSLSPGVPVLMLWLTSLPLLFLLTLANGFEGGTRDGLSEPVAWRAAGVPMFMGLISGSAVAERVRVMEGDNGLGARCCLPEGDMSREYVVWCVLGEFKRVDVLRCVGDIRLCDF